MKMHFRKIATMSLLLLFSSPTAFVAQEVSNGGEVLTNAKVINMSKAGLPVSIIVNKIRASKTNFDISSDELIRLQQARVSTEIINAMVDASSNASVVTSRTGAGDVSKNDPDDPSSAHEAGIYLFEQKDGKRGM